MTLLTADAKEETPGGGGLCRPSRGVVVGIACFENERSAELHVGGGGLFARLIALPNAVLGTGFVTSATPPALPFFLSSVRCA